MVYALCLRLVTHPRCASVPLVGKNIMLKHCDREGCDVTAMICDFGLARECTGVVQSPDMIGTVTHMAPELLRDGVVSLSGGRGAARPSHLS